MTDTYQPNAAGRMVPEASVLMPRYRSHKMVSALKIAEIQFHLDGAATFTPEEPGYGAVALSSAFVAKHDPKVGGYYVVYEDGYKSWSPAAAFEEGYTRISP